MKLNVGCGQTPTHGWLNFDNSPSLRFSKFPFLPELFNKAGLINSSQYEFITFARKNNILYGDATKRLPVPNESCDALYSSHMLEHLDRHAVSRFFKESVRILKPGGILRISVPDISKRVEQYKKSGDADTFIESTLLCDDYINTFTKRLIYLLIGTRHHRWMYDGNSLSRLFQINGFTSIKVMQPGQTSIKNYQPLDLYEKAEESVFVEGEKP